MRTLDDPPCKPELGYAKSLLEERREQLRALASVPERYRSDYSSCRRSLEQAIRELEALLRHEEGPTEREEKCQHGI